MKLKSSIISFLLFFTLWNSGKTQSSEIDSIRVVVDSLIYASQYETAQRLTLQHVKRENLSKKDWFKVNMMYAEVIRSSARPRKAILAFKDILRNLPSMPNRELYESRVTMSIAGCYFDIPNYELAAEYAQRSIAISPDTSIASRGHAVNFLILGYVDFLNAKYPSSLKHYSNSLELYKEHGGKCDLPLVYTKMARVMNRMGNQMRAEELLSLSENINSECRIDVYAILIEETRYSIYRENRNFKEALNSFIDLDSMRSEIEYDEQQSELTELELEYEEELKEAELKNLLELNAKNKEIRKKQNTALITAIAGLVALVILTILLSKSILQKRKAYESLEELNKQLESKVADRTEYLKRANEDVRMQAESIADRSRQLQDFYHLVTHDLRAPMGNLMMLIQLAEEADDDKERKEMNDNMKNVVQVLNTTVSDLVDKTQSHNLLDSDYRIESFERGLHFAEQGLTADIKALKAKIVADFSEAPSVFYSSKILRGIFHNLLSNSLKYSHPDRKPYIQISTCKQEDSIVLKFTDNGKGMDLENNGEKLFSKRGVFHDHPDANGFGLFYLRKQILQTGGEIWAESTPDQGSVFYVRFKD
ncbi:MAG TPA: HAMP domain-containing sensor histidine kinase [Cryomorphaceae bacterium]|nr:HAMP domain-containing sensor histidine kinase [Cryomorphaceae bacterium]